MQIIDAEVSKDQGKPAKRHDARKNIKKAREICARQIDSAEKDGWNKFADDLSADRKDRHDEGGCGH
jgi:hypothetical protein